MKQWSDADHDCREVLVEVVGSGAVISVVTRDGRRARRATRDPASIVPVANAALEAIKLLKKGTLKVYPGFPHGMPATNPEVINRDLLAFFKE